MQQLIRSLQTEQLSLIRYSSYIVTCTVKQNAFVTISQCEIYCFFLDPVRRRPKGAGNSTSDFSKTHVIFLKIHVIFLYFFRPSGDFIFSVLGGIFFRAFGAKMLTFLNLFFGRLRQQKNNHKCKKSWNASQLRLPGTRCPTYKQTWDASQLRSGTLCPRANTWRPN